MTSKTTSVLLQKANDAVFVFERRRAQRLRVSGTLYYPQLTRAKRGAAYCFGVATRNAAVHGSADGQHWKCALRDRLLWNDFIWIKTASLARPAHRKDGSGAEQRLAQPWTYFDACIVVGNLAQAGKRVFGYDGFNPRLDCGRLEGDGTFSLVTKA